MHGSDAPETAAREIAFFFSDTELCRALSAGMNARGYGSAASPADLSMGERDGRRPRRTEPARPHRAPALEAFVVALGAKPFRARQLMKWIYQRGAADFEAMTDLARTFARSSPSTPRSALPEIVTAQVSSDGTRKWLLRADAAQAIEMVYIPETDRGTLCISSQVGCALDCAFCSTAQQGFNRNLSTAEIVGQVWLANRELGFQPGGDRIITNVVLMGMGEPLANFRNVVPALRILLDDLGFDLSRRRVTLSAPRAWCRRSTASPRRSTSRSRSRCTRRTTSCAASWCRSTACIRSPSCSRPAGTTSTKQNGRSVTFEYVMLDGVNDSPAAGARAGAAAARDIRRRST